MAILLGGVFSLPGAEYSKSMFTRVWRSHDGMPGNEVTGISQDGSGYLWITYLNGLAVFDGVRFQPVPLPLSQERGFSIRQLLRTSGDRFWLALDSGTVVCISPLATNIYTAADGLSLGRPLSMTEGRDGSIWIGYSDSSACRIEGKRVTRFTSQQGLGRTGNCRLAADNQGRIWFAQSGRVGLWKEDRFETLFTLAENDHVRLSRARGGGIWICADSQVYRYNQGGELTRIANLVFDRENTAPELMLEDRNGALWIGTYGGGLFRCAGTNSEPIQTSQRTIMSLFEDREGSLWVGTGGGGLNRVRPRVLEVHDIESGLPFETARSTCVDSAGRTWAVARDGSLARMENGTWRLMGQEDGWTGGMATCVAADSKGNVWIGTYRRGALYHWREGQFSRIDRAAGLGGNTIRLLLPDRSGNLWIGLATPTGLQKLKDGKFQSLQQPPGSHAISVGVEDPSGNIWMGTIDGFLLRVDKDRLVDETPSTPWKRRSAITCLQAGADGSLWIGYLGQGLGRLRNQRLEHIAPEQGLPGGRICGLMPDSQGGLWLSTEQGILRASIEALESVAEGRANHVDAIYYGSDELLSLQGFAPYSPGAARTPEGNILFPILTGLAVVHPGRVNLSRTPPQVIIESVTANERPQPLSKNNELISMGPGVKLLEFQFTAPSFINPSSIRFRHKLEGVDEDWVNIGNQRRVSFTHLPPGRYTYWVTACNYAGVWNEAGAEIRFEVRPYLWQTREFKFAGFLILPIGLAGLVRYFGTRQLRREVRRARQEAALDRERARIAKDIHDDLGASLTQISLLSELTMRHMEPGAPGGSHVRKLADTARQAFTDLDEIVWAVNPRNDTLANLLDYLAQFTLDFLAPAPVRCRLDFPSQPPARFVPAEVRHTVFLVLKEALNNILKHARAAEVRVAAVLRQDTLILSIEDDGVGIGNLHGKPGADGLQNMRQRVEALRGTFALNRGTTGGTLLRIEVPLPRESPSGPVLQS